jgi:hypothetical protein
LIVNLLQKRFESLYQLESDSNAEDFLLDAAHCASFGITPRAREEVLVHEGANGLELGLYLDEKLLSEMAHHDLENAANENLNSFCEVAEGVSHFMYLSRAAQLDRHVSLLELEAQAEVDKFALISWLEWGTKKGHQLMEKLFHKVRFHTHLSGEERHRYVEANRLAKVYCSRILPKALSGSFESFFSELRKTYRLGSEAKLRYFALGTT